MVNLIIVLKIWRTSGFSEVVPQNQQTWRFSLIHNHGHLDYEGRFSLFFIFKLLRPRFTKHILEYFPMQYSNLFMWLCLWKHFVMLHPRCVSVCSKTEPSDLQTGLLWACLEWLLLAFCWGDWGWLGFWASWIPCVACDPFCCVPPLEPWAIPGGNF